MNRTVLKTRSKRRLTETHPDDPFVGRSTNSIFLVWSVQDL